MGSETAQRAVSRAPAPVGKKGEYVIDFPFPSQFDPDEKRWLFDEGQIDWLDDGPGPSVMKRWRGRGPQNDEFVENLQRGHRQVAEMLSREAQ